MPRSMKLNEKAQRTHAEFEAATIRERTEREVKTARLKAARLRQEADQVATSADRLIAKRAKKADA